MNKVSPKPQRALSLDALRGYAILTMVLSGTIVFGVLPGWMYHMQEPPPDHAYNAVLAGITWVDLVFPFFLFSMGAAFPFSLRRKYEKGVSRIRLGGAAIVRGMQLTFFAIYIQHFYPWMLSSPQDARSWWLALSCYALLFPMFMRLPVKMPEWAHAAVKVAAYGAATAMLLTTTYADGRTFSLYTSNIIILLLADMAIFGSIIYLCTMYNWKARLVVMASLVGVLLSADVEGSWAQAVFNWSPVPWMYRFNYLAYLCIVIPGSIAGDLVLRWMKEQKISDGAPRTPKKEAFGILAVSVVIILINLVCLYNRWSFVCLVLTGAALIVGRLCISKTSDYGSLWNSLLGFGAALLIVGLCFEPFQGGIKKDWATFSYLFVTSGLACMALMAFNVICDYFKCHKSTAFLWMCGQNPMIAYVSTNLFIYPVFYLIGITKYFFIFHAYKWLGLVQGLFLTSLAMLNTMFFTRIKWFWRT